MTAAQLSVTAALCVGALPGCCGAIGRTVGPILLQTAPRHFPPRLCLEPNLSPMEISLQPKRPDEPSVGEPLPPVPVHRRSKLSFVLPALLMVGMWTWPWLLSLLLSCARADRTRALYPALAQLTYLKVVAARLLVAAACGAVVGLERKDADRPAGLRSLTLVSSGSALYTLAGMYGIDAGDPARAAAQVCTGVGFIGAGVIAKGSFRDPVRGVTTACAVWVSAALGVVAAAGMWLFALYSTGLTVTILRISRWYNAFTRSQLAEVFNLTEYKEGSVDSIIS
ncbi:hypothetical protein AB1Y20_000883 [Prymnesium parvum]|uniref:MgtC/SapB/SrpB/YhiD N-terminal domain-containing protein n=1 Tax=Prymnesium parvum TaxID=97485 RepID=A0AB34K768_PRYPA